MNTTSSITINRVGAALMAGVAAIHLVLAPEYLGEQAYVGVLFLLGAGAGAMIAARLWRAADRVTWALGAAMSAAMAAGFVLSRTVGLPGFHEGEWELSGLLSLLLEGGFVAAALSAAVGDDQIGQHARGEARG
jgi:hypothetical protein